MSARTYLDIDTRGAEDAGVSPPLMRGRLLSILHGCFQKQPGRYAVALTNHPGTLRVFTTDRSEFDALVEAMSPSPWIRDYARIGYPRTVPDNFQGPWVSFRRFRIPTVRSDRDAVDGTSALRDRRITEARAKRMEYFHLQSRSTTQNFVLIVERVPCDGDIGRFKPDSYGFSTTSNTFALPAV